MHFNQFNAFVDFFKPSADSVLMTDTPWAFDGWTYVTDRRLIVRDKGHADGATLVIAEAADEKTNKFLASAARQFDFFAEPFGTLIPMSSLTLEPIIERERVVLAPVDWENPPFNAEEDRYVARSTPIQIHGRCADAKRLLFIRQTLPDVRFYDYPAAMEAEPLRFLFGEHGQGVLMPMRLNSTVRYPLHWNGVRYCPNS